MNTNRQPEPTAARDDDRRRSERKCRMLYESMRDAFACTDMAGRIQECNSSFQQMLGYNEEELRELTYKDLTPPQWHSFEDRILRQQVLLSGHSEVYEKEYRRKDGTVFPVELRTSLVRDDAGKPETMLAIVRDISGRKKAEAALRESEALFSKIFRASPAAIAITRIASGELVDVNEAFLRMFGRTREELLGHTSVELKHWVNPEDRSRLVRLLLEHGRVQEFETKLRRKSGSIGDVVIAAERIDLRGEQYLLAILSDVTERKRAEESLHELSAQLLCSQDEERRRLARELHDTTAQGLIALLTTLGLAQDNQSLDANTRKKLADAMAMANQCATEIRTFSYLLHPPLLEELGLGPAVRDLVRGFEARSGIRITTDIPENLGRLPREAELALFRVLQESLSNVHRHSGSKVASVRLSQDHNQVRLEVTDQGRGLAPENERRLQQTGVGIAGMKERLRQLGGWLQIESGAGGTVVTAILPLARHHA